MCLFLRSDKVIMIDYGVILHCKCSQARSEPLIDHGRDTSDTMHGRDASDTMHGVPERGINEKI